MNKLEKLVYDSVKKNPYIKTTLRNSYQKIFDLFPAKKVKTKQPIINKIGYFYGFHDHSPFSHDSKYLLAQRAPKGIFMPNISNELCLGFFSGKGYSSFNECARTKTWNWHMGCKLQWIGNTDSFIYNDFYRNKGVSKIFNTKTGAKDIIDCQLSSVSKNGKYLIGYDFFLLEKYMPGYGYRKLETDYIFNNDSMQIYLYDFKRNIKKTICSASELKDLKPEKSMNNALHFITHGLFSPCSKKFCFLHRWITNKKDVRERKSRLIICDIQGKILTILPTDGLFSHFCWRNENQLIAFCNTKKFKSAYHLFTLDQNSACIKIEKLTNINDDGHPCVNKDGRIMITDTYPNARRIQTLYLYNFKKGATSRIGEFYMPKKFQSKSIKDHWSVDLHPRLNPEGSKVCFDNTFEGERSLAILDISGII